MEWPPKYVTYQDYRNELMEACNTNPDFEQWLMRKYPIRERATLNKSDELYVDYHNNKCIPCVQNLKEEYYNEMNMLIHEKIIKGVVLDIHLRNFTYTDQDIYAENLYNSKKIEYSENKKLIKFGLLNENIPMFNMPTRMKYKKLLLKLIDDTIKDYSETIEEINSRN
jgi:hypothetical protein